MCATCSRHSQRGFTLVELLIVIAILGVLFALLLPAVQAARESARRSACVSHQKEVGLGVCNYEGTVGQFPPGRIGCDDTGETTPIPNCPQGLPAERKTAASGFVAILPQLEEQVLYDQLSVESGGLWNRNVDDLGWYYNKDKYSAVKQQVEILICPSDTSQAISDVYHPVLAGTGSYAFVQGTLGPSAPHARSKYANDGLFLYVARRKASRVIDGLSKTLMLGEVVLSDTWESSNTWSYALTNADCLRNTENPLNTPPGAGVATNRQNGAFGSQHAGGANFCFADGHIDFVRDDIELAVYRSMSTIRDGESKAVSAYGTDPY
jgi:prepilin-type N-terminal cleavage/methylation domain-containing protein/prepilin-type processing-associated H-X9-DG protein